MNKNKLSPLTVLFIITLVIYGVGFIASKNHYIASKVIVLSVLVSLLIIFVLVLKEHNIFNNYCIVYGAIGLNNAILCAILNSIEIGRNITQQAIILGIHFVVLVIIVLALEFCFEGKKIFKNSKTKASVSTSLITLSVSLGLFLSRYLMRFGIDIRVVGCFSCGFLSCTMFYIFLICERKNRQS